MRRLSIAVISFLFIGTFGVIAHYQSLHPSSDILSAKGLKRLKKKGGSAPDGCTIDVMVFRHCEKGTLHAHCTPEGLRRAEYLSTLFGDGPEYRWPTPEALFARPPEGKRQVVREIELLEPLSQKTSLPIHSDGYEINNKVDMVEDIFSGISGGDWCGGVVVVSWKHENIPKLSKQMGCGPLQGCPEKYPVYEFDQLWSIRYNYATPQFSSKRSGKVENHPVWTVSGSVQRMGFDIAAEDKKIREGGSLSG